VTVATDVCFCCKTAVAAGPDGIVYVAWRHIYPTNLRDIAVARSADGGKTFSTPVRVSEDGWQIAGCPDDGPALAVDESGTLHVVWPTMVGTGPITRRRDLLQSFHGRRADLRAAAARRRRGHGAAHPQIAAGAAAWPSSGTKRARRAVPACAKSPRTRSGPAGARCSARSGS
jgi:hypothetical protein